MRSTKSGISRASAPIQIGSIGSVAPGGVAHTRYLCKRLHARFPELRIIVGRWGEPAGAPSAAESLLESGATAVSSTLFECRQELNSLLPILEQLSTPRLQQAALADEEGSQLAAALAELGRVHTPGV